MNGSAPKLLFDRVPIRLDEELEAKRVPGKARAHNQFINNQAEQPTTAKPHKRMAQPKTVSGTALTFPCNKGAVLDSTFRLAFDARSGSGALKRGRGRA